VVITLAKGLRSSEGEVFGVAALDLNVSELDGKFR